MSAIERMRRAPAPRTIAVLGVAVAGLALYCVLVPLHAVFYGLSPAWALLLGAAVCGAPLLAIVRPRTSIAVFTGGALALPLLVSDARDQAWPWPWSVPAIIAFALFVAVITVAHGWRTGLVPLAVGLLGSLAVTILEPTDATPAAATADMIVSSSIALVAYTVAVLLAGRLRVGAELSRERELTAVEQSRRMLVEERTRIARELHDVVAHSMSLIQVQASTARYRVTGLPAAGIGEFDEIAATARTSLTEMRRLLGVLRTENDTPPLTPQQRITDIPDLIEATRRAGVAVSLTLAAVPTDPPASVQIAAYRIVQEAVSNAVRHAPGSVISVDVGADGHAVTVRVHDDGADAGTTSTGAGHGLRGMRERVALVAGTLAAGPDPAGGWTVVAVLPWTAGEQEEP